MKYIFHIGKEFRVRELLSGSSIGGRVVELGSKMAGLLGFVS